MKFIKYFLVFSMAFIFTQNISCADDSYCCYGSGYSSVCYDVASFKIQFINSTAENNCRIHKKIGQESYESCLKHHKYIVSLYNAGRCKIKDSQEHSKEVKNAAIQRQKRQMELQK